MFDQKTHSCRDGTGGCPVVGTLGSYSCYVLGIFMACVFLVGPKTKFGQSEQNPAYWLHLLLAAKNSNARVTWYDPIKDERCERLLKPSDFRLWVRFVMNFLINGVGFHILVHALPIQVAAQSSLTGVVFRAVGMLYLVDLDDTPGYTMTIVQEEVESKEDPPTPKTASDSNEEVKPVETGFSSKPNATVAAISTEPTGDLSQEAAMIIADAQAKLDALAGKAAGKGAMLNGKAMTTSAGLTLGGGNAVTDEEEGGAEGGADGCANDGANGGTGGDDGGDC